MSFVTVKSHLPANSLLSGYIENYNWLHFDRPVEVKTIPNGRLDAWICLQGNIEWWMPEQNIFEILPSSGFFPLTRQSNKAQATGPLSCISIKFYPHVLTLSAFQKTPLTKPVSFQKIFDSNACEALRKELIDASNEVKCVSILDNFFYHQLFQNTKPDAWMQDVTQALEDGAINQLRMENIAAHYNISIKTLERRFKKLLGLSPKMFTNLIRLQQTTRTIKVNSNNNISHGDLTDALGNGYYDQSHFIKACYKITGLSPKQLFTQLPEQITDFVIIK